MVRYLLFFLLMLIPCSCEKSTDPKQPEGVVNVYIDAIVEKDFGVVYDLLAPQTQEDIDAIYDNCQVSAQLVRDNFPANRQVELLEALHWSAISKAKNGKEFFQNMMLLRGQQFAIGQWEVLGSRAISSEIDGDAAVVRTLAGNSFKLRKGPDDTWRLLLNAETFRKAAISAKANRATIEASVRELKKLQRGLTKTTP